MKILVLNCGSSSIKYKLYNMDNETVLAQGGVERIGIDGAFIKVTLPNGEKKQIMHDMPDHKEGVNMVFSVLLDKEIGAIKSLDEIDAVGHRIVQGGDKFCQSVIVDQSVEDGIEELCDLAPVHNAGHLKGIRAVDHLMPNVPQVCVFDNAFHSTMPDYAYLYAVPYELYEKYHVRRYGFHGTSHRYEWQTAKELLGETCHRVLSCHLGNGSSLCAIEDGVVRDTTMGLTPLDGLMMGTRCGSIDPATVCYLQREGGYTCDEVDTMMNKQSGFLAISENTSDVRDIRDGAAAGDEKCLLALDMFIYKVVAQGAAMIASMSGVDTITFTGGIGENDWATRQAVCECFEWMGVRVDREKNKSMCSGKTGVISTAGSSVTVMVLPTDEEYMIACDVERLTK